MLTDASDLVPVSNLDALAEAGLYGLAGPGGGRHGVRVPRRVGSHRDPGLAGASRPRSSGRSTTAWWRRCPRTTHRRASKTHGSFFWCGERRGRCVVCLDSSLGHRCSAGAGGDERMGHRWGRRQPQSTRLGWTMSFTCPHAPTMTPSTRESFAASLLMPAPPRRSPLTLPHGGGQRQWDGHAPGRRAFRSRRRRVTGTEPYAKWQARDPRSR